MAAKLSASSTSYRAFFHGLGGFRAFPICPACDADPSKAVFRPAEATTPAAAISALPLVGGAEGYRSP